MGSNTNFSSKVCLLSCRNHPKRCSLPKYNVASIVGHLFHLKHNRWLCEALEVTGITIMMLFVINSGWWKLQHQMAPMQEDKIWWIFPMGSGSYNWLEIFFSQYSRPRSFQWSFISKSMPQCRRYEGLIKEHQGAQSIISESQTDSRAVSASWCISGIKSIKTL